MLCVRRRKEPEVTLKKGRSCAVTLVSRKPRPQPGITAFAVLCLQVPVGCLVLQQTCTEHLLGVALGWTRTPTPPGCQQHPKPAAATAHVCL